MNINTYNEKTSREELIQQNNHFSDDKLKQQKERLMMLLEESYLETTMLIEKLRDFSEKAKR